MIRSLIYSLALCFARHVDCKISTYVQPGVTTSIPIPGDYTGKLRPQVHFSAPKGFINDPNGMFRDASGTYHLYYQYNPTGLEAGNQHWGHATSEDLYHWINQPIALFPINASSLIFSGSAVVDVNNTSGFFPNQDNGVVAVFTIATTEPVVLQSQGLAYSYDNGYTFEMFEGNPVLDVGAADFRDPKVVWYEDHWVMVVAYSDEFSIGIFTSVDLKTWSHASNFSSAGLLGHLWECPNLIEIPVGDTGETMWLLQISLNPGAPLGGSATQFFPGHFDGYRFTPVDAAARITDFGKDNYAGQFFYGSSSDGYPISIAWASNWDYTNLVPTGHLEGWRSVMGLPRKQSLRQTSPANWVLVSEPYDLSPIIGDSLMARRIHDGSVVLDYSGVYSNALYFEANATDAVAGLLNFTFSSPVTGEYVQGGVAFGPLRPIWLDRGGINGFDNAFFTNKFSAATRGGISHVAGMIDRSIIEVFANHGEISATNTMFPEHPLTIMSVSVSGLKPVTASVSLAIYALKSPWRSQENHEGMVLGNITTDQIGNRKEGNKTHPSVLYWAEFPL